MEPRGEEWLLGSALLTRATCAPSSGVLEFMGLAKSASAAYIPLIMILANQLPRCKGDETCSLLDCLSRLFPL